MLKQMDDVALPASSLHATAEAIFVRALQSAPRDAGVNSALAVMTADRVLQRPADAKSRASCASHGASVDKKFSKSQAPTARKI